MFFRKKVLKKSELKFYSLKNIKRIEENCWVVNLPAYFEKGDSSKNPNRSKLLLFEDEVLLGAAGSNHQEIIRKGKGLYSHWEKRLYFSTSDNSDPNKNDKSYRVLSIDKLLGKTTISHQLNFLIRSYRSNDSHKIFETIENLIQQIYPSYKLADFGKLFMDDDKISTFYRKFEKKWNSYDRKFNLYELLKLVKNLSGDIAECGVYQGGTSYLISQAINEYKLKCNLYLFDSFEGLSSPKKIDGDYWEKGDMSVPLSDVKSRLKEFEFIKYFKGWIPDVFDGLEKNTYRFLHLDVDLYEPTISALEYFYPLMASGGIILCDDYGFETCPGAKYAMDEFFSSKEEDVVHLSSGQGYIVKLRKL